MLSEWHLIEVSNLLVFVFQFYTTLQFQYLQQVKVARGSYNLKDNLEERFALSIGFIFDLSKYYLKT